jgi:hypothetical protein
MNHKQLILFFFLFPSIIVLAQKPTLTDKINKKLHDANVIATQVYVFSKLAQMSTADFNRHVTVVNGQETATRRIDSKATMTKPLISKGEFTNLDWEPVSYFDEQLFPSAIIGMATYQPKENEMKAICRPLGFRVKSKFPNIRLKWQIECVGADYFLPQGGTFDYIDADSDFLFTLDIGWNYHALSRQVSSTPVTFYFRLFDAEGDKVEKKLTVLVRSVNDWIFKYKDNDLSFLLTAFIQEKHPEVQKILQEALTTGVIHSISGYQDNSGDSVDREVEAVWRALHNRGIKYSSTSVTTGNNKNIHSQAVRTFENAVRLQQANCVEGTIVFASILREMSIHALLDITPTHCILGYYRDEGRGSDIKYIETTLLSDEQGIVDAPNDRQKDSAYHVHFKHAQEEGQHVHDSNKKNNTLIEVDVDLARNKVSGLPFSQD